MASPSPAAASADFCKRGTSRPLVQQAEGCRSSSLSGGGIAVDSGARSRSFDIHGARGAQAKHAPTLLATANQQRVRVRASPPKAREQQPVPEQLARIGI